MTWLSTVAPQAMAITRKQRSKALSPVVAATVGASSPAVVVSATVAEPCATRSAVEIRKAATISGIPSDSRLPASAWPMPLALSTPPNMPPAPVTRMMAQTGPSAPSMIFSIVDAERPPPSFHIATSTVISSATGVWPIILSRFTQVASPSTAPMVASVLSPVLRKISPSGSSSTSMTVPNGGGVASWSAASSPPSNSGTGSTKRFPTQSPNR